MLLAVDAGSIQDVLDLLGAVTDTKTSNTIFGDIKFIESQIGTASQSDASTVFEQMDKIQEFADKGKTAATSALDAATAAKNSSGANLGISQALYADLGVNGQTPTAYAKLQELQKYIKEIQAAALDLGGKQDATSELAQNLVGMVKNLINEQAKLAGLENTGLKIDELTRQQAKDMEIVGTKLEEIDAKVRALQEAMKLDDVVVKTWFESEE
jgi:hypothetical protein